MSSLFLLDSALALTEGTINRLLALDPPTRDLLGTLHGKVVAFDIAGFDLRIYFVPSPRRLQLFAHLESAPDCTIRGSLLSLARLGHAEDKSGQLFSGDVEILGDTALAHRFGRALAHLDIDWEEHLSRIVGDIPAHWLGTRGQSLGQWATGAHQTLERDLGEYLQEEKPLVPTPSEVHEFSTDVERLRDNVERLAARLDRLNRLQRSPS